MHREFDQTVSEDGAAPPAGHAQQRITAVMLGATVATLLLAAVGLALEVAIDIPVAHLDGAYQTASGLFRLHAGHLPGRDFFPYLGVGVLYAIYPLFEMAGAHLAASVFAAQLAVSVACALAVALVWHLVWRPSSFLVSLVCGAFLTFGLGSIALYPDIVDLKILERSLSVDEFMLVYATTMVFVLVAVRVLWPLRTVRQSLVAAATIFLLGCAYYAASSAQVGTFAVLFLGVLWFRLVWPAQWMWRTLAAATITTMLLASLADLARDTNIVRWAFIPGNSLRPLRAWLPYVAAFWLFVILGKSRRPANTYLTAGALTGSLLLWANDFAWSTAAMVAACFLFCGYRSRTLAAINSALFLTAALLTAGVLFFVASGGYPNRIFAYNFLDVARDQWWYFPAWVERYRVFSHEDLVKLILPRNVVAALVLVIVAIHAMRKRSLAGALLLLVGAALAAGGAVASIGGQLGRYFGGLHFWAYTVAVVAMLRLFWKTSWRYSDRRQLPLNAASRAAWIPRILMLAAMAILTNSVVGLLAARQNAAAATERFFVPELGGYLKSSWKPYVETARSLTGSVVFEEYWGVLSAIQKRTPLWPVDSVIHALGSKRELLASSVFSQADIIVTTRNTYTQLWHPWLISQNYWLYSRLFREFDAVDFGPNTVIWRRGAKHVFQPMECRVADDGAGMVVSAMTSGYAEVEVVYRVAGGPRRKLVMLRNNINIVGGIRGYFSVDPAKTSLVFPAYLKEKGQQVLDFRVVPAQSSAVVSVESCQAGMIQRVIPDVLEGVPRAVAECLRKWWPPDPETLWPWERGEPQLDPDAIGDCDGRSP